jgi:hypothetical protein
MRRISLVVAVLSGFVFAPAAFGQVPAAPPFGQPAATPTLKLVFEADGTVSLSAQNVTVREILAAWARQCGCYVVNGDKLAGSPIAVPIEFTNAPQNRVLESLLRQAAGYVLTPRRAGSAAASHYETIYILATSNPTSAPSGYSAYTPPTAVPLVTPGSPEDELPPLVPQPRVVPTPQMPQSPPLPGQPVNQPPGQPANQPAGQPPANRPGVGVPAPAIIVPIGPAAPATTTPAPGTAPPTPPGTAPPPVR